MKMQGLKCRLVLSKPTGLVLSRWEEPDGIRRAREMTAEVGGGPAIEARSKLKAKDQADPEFDQEVDRCAARYRNGTTLVVARRGPRPMETVPAAVRPPCGI